MFPFKSEPIADKRTTNFLRSEEKKERTYFKSDLTCFKANNSVSTKGHRSSQTHFSIKNCRSRKRRNGWESRTRFNFPDHPDRVPQMSGTDVSICLRRRVADRCRSYKNQALSYTNKRKSLTLSLCVIVEAHTYCSFYFPCVLVFRVHVSDCFPQPKQHKTKRNMENSESFLLSLYFKSVRTNPVVGYFAHIVRHKQDGIIVKY